MNGVIGMGSIGKTLARKFSAGGHEVGALFASVPSETVVFDRSNYFPNATAPSRP